MRTWLLRLLGVAVVLGVWEWYGRRTNPILFTYPTAIAQAGVLLARQGSLVRALTQTLSVLGWGLLFSVVIGIAVGLAIGRSRTPAACAAEVTAAVLR